MSSSEAPWKAIVARKQSERAALIPSHWRIPSKVLPSDPPKPTDGPQPVLDVPRQFLSQDEISITESYTIPTLLSAIASRTLSATTVATAFCHRAAIAHQLTNCITEPLFNQALARAKELDAYLARHGSPIGPLHGLPVSVKDTFNIAGVDTTIGIASLCFKPATSNAPLVDLLISLGCVIVAKTNIPQTLASLDSINNVFGRTMNPLNRLLTAGGSSGGEGVLVAMKGSMIGIGTDIGGSIRIPAMCNGVYGFKPSTGRLPYGGQQMTGPAGVGRTSVQACAGPIGRSVEDIEVFMRGVVPRAKLWADDCWVSTGWDLGKAKPKGYGPRGEYVIGILRSDGNCDLLPPIRNVINEVAERLKGTQNVKVVELKTPKAWTKSQSAMNKLMGADGGAYMADLLEATKEPLVPWMATRFRKGKPRALFEVAQYQDQRAELTKEMLQLWVHEDEFGRRKRVVNAIVCPLAPHPVPEIERYNSVGYTSSWVLFDMPAASVPVRTVTEADLELGKNTLAKKPISSWDERCRDLWMEDKTDRKVYLNSPLSVQVVVPRAEDDTLIDAMRIVDDAMRGTTGSAKARL